MTDLIFNTAKGRIAHYADLRAPNDALMIVPIQAAGVEADATLRDHASLASILAGTTDEQASMGRKTITGVTVSIDNAADVVTIAADDATWPAATGSALHGFLICYVPDITAGTDADVVPLVKREHATTPTRASITAKLSDGIAQVE